MTPVRLGDHSKILNRSLRHVSTASSHAKVEMSENCGFEEDVLKEHIYKNREEGDFYLDAMDFGFPLILDLNTNSNVRSIPFGHSNDQRLQNKPRWRGSP